MQQLTALKNDECVFSSFIDHLVHCPNSECKWTQSAIKTAKIAAGILIIAALSFSMGHLMEFTSTLFISYGINNSSLLIQGIQKSKEGFFLIANCAFLSVGIPVYLMTWAAPQWVWQKGAPYASQLAHENALPLAVVKTSKWFWNTVVITASHQLIDSIHKTENVIYKIMQKIYDDYAIGPLSQIVVNATKRVWQLVLIPISYQIIDTAKSLKDRFVITHSKYRASEAKSESKNV